MVSQRVIATRYASLTIICSLLLIPFFLRENLPLLMLPSILLSTLTINMLMMLFFIVVHIVWDNAVERFSILRNETNIWMIGHIASSAFYSWILSNWFIDTILSRGVVSNLLIFAVLMGSHLVIGSTLDEAKVDIIADYYLTNMLVWFVGGGISGVLFAIILLSILGLFPIYLLQNPIVILLTGFLAGGGIAALTILGRDERLQQMSSQVVLYNKVLEDIKTESPYLLVDAMDSKYPAPQLIDYNEAREGIEHSIPLVMFLSSCALFFLLVSISETRRMLSVGVIDYTSLLYLYFLVVLFLISTISQSRITWRIYKAYQNWRRIWADVWTVVRLVSIPKAALKREIVLTRRRTYINENDIKPSDLKNETQKLFDEHEIKEDISRSNRIAQIQINNAILYDYCNDILEGWEAKDKNNRKLIEEARTIVDNIKDFSQETFTELLAKAVLCLDTETKFELSQSMIDDLEPIIINPTKNESLFQTAVDQLSYLESTPKRVVPDSIKWLPVIYGVSFWIASTLFG